MYSPAERSPHDQQGNGEGKRLTNRFVSSTHRAVARSVFQRFLTQDCGRSRTNAQRRQRAHNGVRMKLGDACEDRGINRFLRAGGSFHFLPSDERYRILCYARCLIACGRQQQRRHEKRPTLTRVNPSGNLKPCQTLFAPTSAARRTAWCLIDTL